jgi:hypothetical protein
VIYLDEYPTPHRHIGQLSLVIPANAGIQIPLLESDNTWSVTYYYYIP